MKCPYCNQEHPDNTKFCPETGKKFEPFKACQNPECPDFGKYILPWGSCYCPVCGTPTNESNCSSNVNGKALSVIDDSKNIGKRFEKNAKSVLDTYPEYDFKPATINDKRGLLQKIILTFSTLVFAYFGLGFTVGGIGLSCKGDSLGIVMIIGGVIILTLYYFLILKRWYLNTPTKSQVVDYIQTTEGKTICVKNRKFGVLNNFNNKLIIPTIYDKLTWIQKDKLLRAEQNGESFLIDIHDNRLK